MKFWLTWAFYMGKQDGVERNRGLREAQLMEEER